MKKVVLALIVASLFSTTAMAVEIAISTNSGWWGQAAADQEMQDIADNVQDVPVQLFTINDLNALADWVIAHTGDGSPDLLILCGKFPETIYPSGNAQPDGSLAELFLDDGNTIINTGDYIFYVGTAANNDAGGLANMMDLPGVGMWGDDSLATTFVPTADGQLYTPSLPTTPSNRPWIASQFEGTDWSFELILAESSDGAQVHPGILRNSATGGRLGVFFQVADQFTDVRGEVISEWINNWYLPTAAAPAQIASKPVPATDATDVPADTILSWKPSVYAATHDVYLGTSLEDVDNAGRTSPGSVLVSQGQTDVQYVPTEALEFGQTYYWRVDEVNAAPDNTIFKGGVWSFTVEPYAYPLTAVTATASSAASGMGPQNTVNGGGLNADDQHSTDAMQMWLSTNAGPHWIQYEFPAVEKLHEMWVWNSNQAVETFLGFGVKQATIEYSTDGATWTALEGVPEFAQASGTATYAANTTVSFGGVMAQYVRVTVESNWGGVAPQAGLSEVRFFAVPIRAREPLPADGAAGVSVATELDWRPGREATSHVVSLGTDSAAVADGTAPAETVADHGYAPAGLLYGTQYFWKVDEVGDTGTFAGDVWSFTTEPYAVVEDFESYTNDIDAEATVWHAWIDGLTNNQSGSQVGYDVAPFAERTVVHGGVQAMPLKYGNSSFAFSEATRTFDAPQDWTARGIQSLSLFFAGTADNTGQLYLKINSTKIPYEGDAAALTRGVWQVWNIDLSTVGNVGSVRSLTIGVEGAGASGLLFVDDIRLYPKAPEYITPVDPGSANLAALYTLDGNANDSSGKGNNGTVTGAQNWVPGMIGQALQFDGATTYVDCGSGASLNLTDAVTVTAWIKMDFTAGDRKIAGNQDGTTGGYKLGLFTNNKVEFEVRTAANAATLNRNSAGGTALQQGVWYHVAGVYSKGQFMRTYVFGNLDREMATTAVLGSSTGTFKLGREPSAASYYWLGAMDDVRVYNRVLSAEEILWVMGQTAPVAKPF